MNKRKLRHAKVLELRDTIEKYLELIASPARVVTLPVEQLRSLLRNSLDTILTLTKELDEVETPAAGTYLDNVEKTLNDLTDLRHKIKDNPNRMGRSFHELDHLLLELDLYAQGLHNTCRKQESENLDLEARLHDAHETMGLGLSDILAPEPRTEPIQEKLPLPDVLEMVVESAEGERFNFQFLNVSPLILAKLGKLKKGQILKAVLP